MADLTITAASVTFTSGSKEQRNAGAALTAGQAVYLDSATDTYKLAQCDGTAAEADVRGVVLHAAGSGQPATIARTGSSINIGAATAKTTTYVLSATAGGIAPQADLVSTNRIVRIGYATGTTGAFVVDIKNTGASV